MDKHMYDLINELAECQAACNFCFNACLEEADVQMMTRCIKLDKDCSEICGLALSLVASDSEFSEDILELCIAACEACAEECKKHNYEHCQECAKACQKCAEACRNYQI